MLDKEVADHLANNKKQAATLDLVAKRSQNAEATDATTDAVTPTSAKAPNKHDSSRSDLNEKDKRQDSTTPASENRNGAENRLLGPARTATFDTKENELCVELSKLDDPLPTTPNEGAGNLDVGPCAKVLRSLFENA